MDFIVLALPGARLSSIGAFLDLFGLASERVRRIYGVQDDIGMQSRIRLLTPDGTSVRLSDGRTMAADGDFNSLSEAAAIHIASFGSDETNVVARATALPAVLHHLRRLHEHGTPTSASGATVALLAAAGILDGRAAAIPKTSHLFYRRHFPRVIANRRNAVIEDNGIFTATGFSREFALLLALLERVTSPHLAGWIGQVAGHASADGIALSDNPLVAGSQLWLSERLAQRATIAELCQWLGISEQTLIRHFRSETGMTPRAYQQSLRIASAQNQLRNTTRPVAQIAALVGYEDVKAFRNTFKSKVGMSPRAYRTEAAAPARERGRPAEQAFHADGRLPPA
jgi:transcriptional regulator GlxA family with amidase domain